MGRFSDSRRTNGMLFSEAHKTENSTVSADSAGISMVPYV